MPLSFLLLFLVSLGAGLLFRKKAACVIAIVVLIAVFVVTCGTWQDKYGWPGVTDLFAVMVIVSLLVTGLGFMIGLVMLYVKQKTPGLG